MEGSYQGTAFQPCRSETQTWEPAPVRRNYQEAGRFRVGCAPWARKSELVANTARLKPMPRYEPNIFNSWNGYLLVAS